MTHAPTACERYDHLELACVRGYALHLALVDGDEATGVARDLRTVAGDGEYLEIEADGECRAVRLDRILRLIVTTPDAEFDTVPFGVPDAS